MFRRKTRIQSHLNIISKIPIFQQKIKTHVKEIEFLALIQLKAVNRNFLY